MHSAFSPPFALADLILGGKKHKKYMKYQILSMCHPLPIYIFLVSEEKLQNGINRWNINLGAMKDMMGVGVRRFREVEARPALTVASFNFY